MNLWKKIVSCLDPRCFLYIGRLPWNSSKVSSPDVDIGIENLSDRIKEANEQINAVKPEETPAGPKKDFITNKKKYYKRKRLKSENYTIKLTLK